MFRSFRGSVIWGISVLIALAAVTWLALEYFVPSLPARITIGAGGKGTSFEYFAEHYRKRFARAGVNLIIRETAGALENLKLLKDPNSGVQIGFVTGGLANSEDAPTLLSMGLFSNVPFWIFYPSSESLTGLSQLRGKRIAVGPEGSGARYTAERLLSKADINAKTSNLLPLSGDAAVEELMNRSADAALIVGGSDAPSVAKLLTNTKLRVMDFPTAEALTRIFPDLVRLVLPKGVIEIDPPNPPEDITLVGTTAKVLVRDDLHPAIVQLLARTMKRNTRDRGFFSGGVNFPRSKIPNFRSPKLPPITTRTDPHFWRGICRFG